MKQLIIITLSTIAISFIGGCSSKTEVAPSRNSALNSISSSGKDAKASYIQKSLDGWLKDEWTPTVSKDDTIQKKYMKKTTVSQNGENNETLGNDSAQEEESSYEEDENRTFTLQEYVDKASAYLKANPHDDKNSNVKKLETIPVIGK